MPSNMKYFCGGVELTKISSLKNADFAARFPGVKGRKCDSYSMQVGQPLDFVPVWDKASQSWTKNWLPVERVIQYKSHPSKHVCDARCVNATGRIMKCECACGGKNHGKGAFACEAL